MLNTVNGGTNWVEQTNGTQFTLSSVYFINDLVGWAVVMVVATVRYQVRQMAAIVGRFN